MKKRLLFIFAVFFSLYVTAQDGVLDTSFNPGTGANDSVWATAIQSDGKIIIGGFFTNYNGVTRNYITRLNSDGSLDATFNSGSNNSVGTIAIQPDGKIIIAGDFFGYNGTAINTIARLNSDGSLDATFNPGTGASNAITSVAIQSDEKIIIAGYFTSYNGVALNHIARLNSDGSLDTTFNIGTGVDGNAVGFITLQPDGKIIISGEFSAYNGINRNFIARLNSNGSLDTTFNPGAAANGGVYATSVLSNGKIIIGGDFFTYNGVAVNHIARLNSDGSLDTSFVSGLEVVGTVFSNLLQPDGKIIIGGSFATYGGLSRNNIARLNSDGSLDTTFNSSVGTNEYVWSTAIQPDGKIVAVGGFTSYDGVSRNYIARINNTLLNVNNNVFESNGIVVFKNNTALHIEALNTIIKSVKIFDITGRMLLEKNNINDSQTTIENLNSSQQVLIVQIEDSNNRLVNKKILY